MSSKSPAGRSSRVTATEERQQWKKKMWWAFLAMTITIAVFLFCLFYFGSRV